MCLVIAVILGIVSFNAFTAGNTTLGYGTAAGSLLFAILMARNILTMMKLKRKEKQHDDY